MEKNQYTLIKLENKFIIVSKEEIKGNEWYLWNNSPVKNHIVPTTDGDMWSNDFHKSKLKIIAGIPELPSIDFSALSEEDCKKIGWVDIDKLSKSKFPEWKLLDKHDWNNLKDGFFEGFKAAQSLNEKKFSEEEMKGFTKWLDENWRRGKGKKGGGWFHVGDFYKQAKPVKTENLMDEYIKYLSQPKVFDVEVEMKSVYDGKEKIGVTPSGEPIYMSKHIDIPKITNNSIKITKIL